MNKFTSGFRTGFGMIFVLTFMVANAQPLEPIPGPRGLYGYKNGQTGALVIPYQYDIAHPFTNGFAYVAIDSIGSYIDKTGRTVATGSIYAPSYFSHGLALVRIFVDDDHKYGYIDTTGKQVIAPMFDDAYPFSSGLALVSMDKRLYYIDTTGNIVIDIDPYAARPFSGELAFVREKEGRWGCIDKTGKFVIDYRYNMVGNFLQGIAAVRWGEYWGYITDKGAELVPCQYRAVMGFSDNRASVQYDRLRGYIDKTGRSVIPTRYIFASAFENGLACVQRENDLRYGYIDTLGKTVIKFQFDRASTFFDGLACVRKNGRFGFIDRKGKVVIKHRYHDALRFSNGLACVSDGRKYGFIDVTGNLVIPMEYDRLSNFDSRGLAQVVKDGQTYYVNKRGESVKTRDSLYIDEKPKFQGRDEKSFSAWVNSQIKYPPDASEHRIEGTVYLTFVIDTDGSVTDVEVLQGVFPDLDEEAVRVVSSSPKWTPGLQRGEKPVKVRYNFPIVFQLRRSPIPNPINRQVR